MSAVIDKEKVYKPINGEEGIDLILNKFRDELVNSGMFPLHRTWHEFEFVGGVRVEGWSTKTEEIKFEVSGGAVTPEVLATAEKIESRVSVRLTPAPPSLLRESLPTFECPNKCGKAFHSKESLKGHLNRWCKVEVKNETIEPNAVEAVAPTGQGE